MNIIKLIVDIVLDLIINPIEDIAAPYRRASRRLNQDLAKSPRIPFDIEKSKIIVFSDFHRGAMEKSPVLDRFKLNETVYKEALDYYYKNGFTVVLLGDIEEGWGHNNNMDAIFKSYCRTMHLENQFVISDRYYRVYGNHDDFWAKSKNVDKVINSDMELMEKNKKVSVYPGIVFESPDGKIKIFMTHGHQGQNLREAGDNLARLAVYFKYLLKGKSKKKPLKIREKIRKQEFRVLKWADPRDYLVVMGHTHCIYFGSFPVSDYEEDEAADLKKKLRTAASAEEKNKLEELLEFWEVLVKESDDTTKRIRETFSGLKPGVFNSGNCCVGKEVISGIEIADGRIRVVFWKQGAQDNPISKEKYTTDLASLFS